MSVGVPRPRGEKHDTRHDEVNTGDGEVVLAVSTCEPCSPTSIDARDPEEDSLECVDGDEKIKKRTGR